MRVDSKPAAKALAAMGKAVPSITAEALAQGVQETADAASNAASSGPTQDRRIAAALRVVVRRSEAFVVWGGGTPIVSGGGTVSDLSRGVEFGGGWRFSKPYNAGGYYVGAERSRVARRVEDEWVAEARKPFKAAARKAK